MKIEPLVINEWTEEQEKHSESTSTSSKRGREIALKVNEIIEAVNACQNGQSKEADITPISKENA